MGVVIVTFGNVWHLSSRFENFTLYLINFDFDISFFLEFLSLHKAHNLFQGLARKAACCKSHPDRDNNAHQDRIMMVGYNPSNSPSG